jgi:SET and MYND domain-containing protein 4
MLHNIQLLELNDHEIGEFKKAENEDTGRSIVIGDGLYPSLALFNHSCAPGIVR